MPFADNKSDTDMLDGGKTPSTPYRTFSNAAQVEKESKTDKDCMLPDWDAPSKEREVKTS